MKKSFVAAAVMAGMIGPASAATLDFTADNERDGITFDGISWEVTSEGGALVDAGHFNDNGCGPYACFEDGDPANRPFDVGFGVRGANNNEIDFGSEAVIVTFGSLVKITGFAGMLAYMGQQGAEAVQLEYSKNFGATWLGAGDYVATSDVEIGENFDTVGLAFLGGLALYANAVRFKAVGSADDNTINVTAAALHIAPVPVPASLPLLLAGIGALGYAARRKRKSA